MDVINNPLDGISWLRFLEIDWWQFVPFVEVGRVAPKWEISTLHKDMKWAAGLGLRFMTRKTVVRFDATFAEESAGLWFFVGQPF